MVSVLSSPGSWSTCQVVPQEDGAVDTVQRRSGREEGSDVGLNVDLCRTTFISVGLCGISIGIRIERSTNIMVVQLQGICAT